MRKITQLAFKEWKVFFHTPQAMVILPLYLVLCGTYFYAKLDSYLNLANPNETIQSVAGLNVTYHFLLPFFRDLLNIFIFIIPLITMRTFAEEKKLGTYDLLVSYPIKPWEILFGKYLGALLLVGLLVSLSFIFPVILVWKGEPYLPQVFSSYLGLLLFLTLYVACGVVASLLTENQILAAILTYGAFFSTILFQWLAYISVAPWDRFFANFLFISHLESFRSGLIFAGDIIAYLCVTFLILYWGYHKLRRHFIS